jgi:hypothetical protein
LIGTISGCGSGRGSLLSRVPLPPFPFPKRGRRSPSRFDPCPAFTELDGKSMNFIRNWKEEDSQDQEYHLK